MGEPETHHFYDFGTFGHGPEPHTNYFDLGRHKDTKKQSRESLEHFQAFFIMLISLDIHVFDQLRKDGHRQMMKSRLIKSQKSWM